MRNTLDEPKRGEVSFNFTQVLPGFSLSDPMFFCGLHGLSVGPGIDWLARCLCGISIWFGVGAPNRADFTPESNAVQWSGCSDCGRS